MRRTLLSHLIARAKVTRFNHTKNKQFREEKQASLINCSGMNVIKKKFKDLLCFKVSKVYKCVLKSEFHLCTLLQIDFLKLKAGFPITEVHYKFIWTLAAV